jgi:hypothetical protein
VVAGGCEMRLLEFGDERIREREREREREKERKRETERERQREGKRERERRHSGAKQEREGQDLLAEAVDRGKPQRYQHNVHQNA